MSEWSLTRSRGDVVDRLGAVASGVCAAHCAVCAALPGALGVLGLGALLGHEAEWTLTLVAVGLGLVALMVGWRRHRSARVAIGLSMGIVGLLLARRFEEGGGPMAGAVMGVAAGLLLVMGHFSNMYACRRCSREDA
ncbi:MAG: MerC family mercury resistance protein [Myxococcota bacterium]